MNNSMDGPSELRVEQRKIIQAAVAAALFCTLSLAAGYFVLPRYFQFPTELADRLAFALRADVFVLLWVVAGVRMVSKGRFHSQADIGGSAASRPSPRIAIQAAFLQNTLEQAFIAVGAHLTLATLVEGPELSLIVVAVALFGIGRITFWFGYPHGAGGRAFGMALTALPTVAAYALAIALMVFGADQEEPRAERIVAGNDYGQFAACAASVLPASSRISLPP